jgi:hypothetical protein
VIVWLALIEPLSVAVAGAASLDVAVAVSLKAPGVEEVVSVTEIGGSAVPAVSAVPVVYVHEMLGLVTVQVYPVPEAAVGTSDAGKVSVTTTFCDSLAALALSIEGVRVTVDVEPAVSTPLPLSVLVRSRDGDAEMLDTCKRLI